MYISCGTVCAFNIPNPNTDGVFCFFFFSLSCPLCRVSEYLTILVSVSVCD